MSDTSEQELKSRDAARLEKLSRMSRSISRRFPGTKLERTRDGFGVLLGGERWLRVRATGSWTNEDMRDLLVFFATWLAVDGDYLRAGGTTLAGSIVGETGRQS